MRKVQFDPECRVEEYFVEKPMRPIRTKENSVQKQRIHNPMDIIITRVLRSQCDYDNRYELKHDNDKTLSSAIQQRVQATYVHGYHHLLSNIKDLLTHFIIVHEFGNIRCKQILVNIMLKLKRMCFHDGPLPKVHENISLEKILVEYQKQTRRNRKKNLVVLAVQRMEEIIDACYK